MREINNFRELLYGSAEEFSDKIAFLEKNQSGAVETVSYSKLKDDAESLGKALISRGMKGKKIAISGKNSYHWCLCYLAITCFVGVVVPVDKELPEEEFMNIIEFSGAELFIGDDKTLSVLKGRANIITVNMKSGVEALINEGKKLETELSDSVADSNEMSVLLFTSGTTGMTKGVMLSQKNICSDLTAVWDCIDLSEKDRSLSVLPLHHTYECIAFLMMIYCGGSVAFSGSIRTLKDDFQLFRPTVLVCVPLLLERFYKMIVNKMKDEGKRKKAQLITSLSGIISDEARRKIFADVHAAFGGKLKKIVVGAAALNEEIEREFISYGFSVVVGYGLTECSPIVICNSVMDSQIGSIGKPLKTAKVEIRDKDENDIGEICVKGPMVMLGYYKNSEATEKVLKDGWFYTGDLGYADRYGYYHITGRKKNVVVTKNGKNIYPEELEFYLMKHSVIKETVVTSERGDIITAHVLPDEEAIARRLRKAEATPAEIKKAVTLAVREVNRKVPSYKNIRDIVIRTTEFTKTTTHKIKRQ